MRSSISFSPRFLTSSERSSAAFNSFLASSRTLRRATLASSTFVEAVFTISLRLSSVSGGTGTRTTRPSSAGFKPSV